MSDAKLGQLAVLHSQQHWQEFREAVALELARQHDVKTVSIEFPKDPASYPCLVAATILPADPAQPENFDEARVICCFVYPADAQRLVAAAQAGEPSYSPEVRAPEAEAKHAPGRLGVLVLGLVLELKQLGALKRERLYETLNRVEGWLEEHADVNLNASLPDLLDRLWEDDDARESG